MSDEVMAALSCQISRFSLFICYGYVVSPRHRHCFLLGKGLIPEFYNMRAHTPHPTPTSWATFFLNLCLPCPNIFTTYSLIWSLFAVVSFLWFGRANQGFRSFKKENILRGSRLHAAEWGLCMIWEKASCWSFMFSCRVYLSQNFFSFLMITGMAVLVRISCIWFNICRAGVPGVG